MRFKEAEALLGESLSRDMVHRNTTASRLKAIAKNDPEYHSARFTINGNGEMSGAHPGEFTHHQIDSTHSIRGFVYYRDGKFSYDAYGKYDMHPAAHPKLDHLERMGIERARRGSVR